MLTIHETQSEKKTLGGNQSEKLVETMVISLAHLIGYGVHETRRTVQKLMAHKDFRDYQEGITSKEYFLDKIGAKFKLSTLEVEEILISIVLNCRVDEDLTQLGLIYSENILGLMDIPELEWNSINQLRPDLTKYMQGLAIVTIDEVNPNWIVIARDPEVASIHRSEGIVSIPYNSKQLDFIKGHLRTLNPSVCYQQGLLALNETLETYKLSSIIEMDLPNTSSDKSTDVGVLQEFFNPLLIAIYFPDILLPELEAKVVEMVTSGPFGYFGTEFNRLPADIDTMSLNVAVLYEMGSINYEEAFQAMEWVLSNRNEEGILQVYFDKDRPRVDHVVLCNMIYASYTLGLESHPIVKKNEQLVHQYFLNSGYMFGTKYYHTPETFLFHFGRVLAKFSDRIPNYKCIQSRYNRALLGRLGHPSSALDIAKRLLMSHEFQLPNYADGPLLLSMQKNNGFWEPSDLYLLPTTKGRVYNPAVDMCFCLKALELIYLSNASLVN